MALSWNEIKDRSLKFSKEWAKETKERAEKDTFNHPALWAPLQRRGIFSSL